MQDKLDELKKRLVEINDISSAAGMLYWDQSTYMPPGGAAAHARQSATLSRIAHERFIDPVIGRLLEDLAGYEQSLPWDSDEASLIRVTRREYRKAVRVPAWYTEKMSALESQAFDVWTRARPANDFSAVQPYLEQLLDMSRQYSDFFPGYDHIADPLIDVSDYGLKAADVRETFGRLREQLVPLVQAVADQPPVDDSCIHQTFSESQQLAFGTEIVKRFGYDFNRGRQDKTHHPFMIKFSLGDVRITTRVREGDLSSLFSTMHEAGHAMYEQSINPACEATPLGSGTSMSVHESQSRLWENYVGRSREFWSFFYPKLQSAFPDQFRSVPLDVFYRAINIVRRSLIRVDADELTYNLHVMIRFELELEMLEGKLRIADLPQAWRDRYRSDIGLVPPDDKDGVLQDIHWFIGPVGGRFQGYTLGNVLAAQFFDAALRAKSDIPNDISQGNFQPLGDWLKENIYRHGSKFTTSELIERATGQPLTIDPYIRYLQKKFTEIYSL